MSAFLKIPSSHNTQEAKLKVDYHSRSGSTDTLVPSSETSVTRKDSGKGYHYLSPYSPSSSRSPSPSPTSLSPSTMVSHSMTLVDPENPESIPHEKKTPSAAHRIMSGIFSYNVLFYGIMFALIGTMAGTLNFTTGCFALGTCSTYWVHGNKHYRGTEWLGLGPVGGLFATAPAALAFYCLTQLYYFLKGRAGRPVAFVILMILVPITYIGASIFGGFVSWELLHHTLKGDYDSRMLRALLMALTGSAIFSVPFSLIILFKEWGK